MRQASRTSGTRDSGISADISGGMLGARPRAVKPKPLQRQVICPAPGPAADCILALPGMPCLSTVLLLLAVAVIIAALALAVRRRSGRRKDAVIQVLDAADALEERLRTARVEIEAIVGSDQNPVRDAMQEMLRQRLWLQQHGPDASLEQLQTVRNSIDAARVRIEQQLVQIDRARTLLL